MFIFLIWQSHLFIQDKRHIHPVTIILYAVIISPVEYFYTEFSRAFEIHYKHKPNESQCLLYKFM